MDELDVFINNRQCTFRKGGDFENWEFLNQFTSDLVILDVGIDGLLRMVEFPGDVSRVLATQEATDDLGLVRDRRANVMNGAPNGDRAMVFFLILAEEMAHLTFAETAEQAEVEAGQDASLFKSVETPTSKALLIESTSGDA